MHLPLDVPLTPVPGNLLTNGLAVACLALLHIQIAAYLQGAAALSTISQGISLMRRDPRHEQLAHGLVKSMAYLFGFGAAVAIFWVLWVLLALWGRFWVTVSVITFWPLVFEAGAFFSEIALLYTLYANWDRLERYRGARFGMSVMLTIVMWWQMFFIDIVATYMLTPNNGDTNQRAQVLNPTFLPLQIHRTVGNIAWAGAAIAFYAAFSYLRATRRTRGPATDPALAPARSIGAMAATEFASAPPDGGTVAEERRRYLDWLGHWGALWAVGLSLFQIWIGYSYAKEIQLHAFPAWYRMMRGVLSNVFLTQIFLLGMIFTLGCLYFWRRMRASGITRLWVQKLCFVILVLATVLAVQPAWFAVSRDDVLAAHLDRPWWSGGLMNPIGNFIPNKVFALILLMVFGLISATNYVHAYSEGRVRMGETTRRLQVVLLALGVTVSLIMMVMGVIRENGRQPYLIYGEMRLQHQSITNGSGP
jgi:cytochrome d ubiquinol oxidase subunit I